MELTKLFLGGKVFRRGSAGSVPHFFLLVLILALPVQPVQAGQPVSISNLHGNFTQGGVFFGRVPEGTQVFWGERQVFTTAQGDFAVGLDRDAPESMDLILIDREGNSSEATFAIAQRNYKLQHIEGIARKIMNPNPADLERIGRESAMVGQARAARLDRRDFLGRFEWPLLGRITGVFGSQRVYNGVPKRPHYGVDVAAAVGTRVRAPAGGQVTLAQDDLFYSGGTLIIDHGYGLSSSFLHLSRLLVSEGEEIVQGQLIAEVGATGRVTGPHLDWRMNWYDQRVDPQLLVEPMASAQSKTKITGITHD